MANPHPFRLLCATILLASCQQTPHAATPLVSPEFPTNLTVADARAAVAGYLQSQPNPTRYLLDSARISDSETAWFVLVPRTTLATGRPDSVYFEVDKVTGAVHPAAR